METANETEMENGDGNRDGNSVEDGGGEEDRDRMEKVREMEGGGDS
jgi:hypothetical protein